MSNPTQAPQFGPPATPPAPTEAPKQLRTASTFMFVLLAIGLVSMVIDFVVAGTVADTLAGKVTGLDGKPVTSSWFNPGTMYVTLVFGLVIGILGLPVRKGSNGARITGAIFAIIFTLMGLGSMAMTVLISGTADLAAKNAGLGMIVPNWYWAGGVLIGLLQVVFSILAIVKLFNSNSAAYCKAPKA